MPADRPHLSPGQAQYVLNRLLDDRQISAADVERSLQGLEDEIRAVDERLTKLRSLAGAPGTPPEASQANQSRKRRAPTRRANAKKAEASPARKLHGSYIGYLRQFPEKKRRLYKAMADTDGKAAAVRKMKESLGK
jgi:hypothetical protein